MRNVDLELFQFDYDLTWAGLFMEPDGTVLGRYGAGSRDSMHYNSLEGLKNAMSRAEKLHENFDSHKLALSLKRAKNIKFKWPRDLPHNDIKKIVENDTAAKNCIHCHMVQEGLNKAIVKEPNYHPNKIRSLYPTPEKLGVLIDAAHGLKVTKVIPGTGAADAGLKPGDVLTEAQGQPLIGIADFIWALREVDDPGLAKIRVHRGKKSLDFDVALKSGWKLSDISWRVSSNSLPPELRLWVVPASDGQRRAGGIAKDQLALRVKGVFGREAKKAGIRKGDIITAVGSWHPNGEAHDFVQHIRLNYYQPNSKIPITVMRGQRKLDLSIQF